MLRQQGVYKCDQLRHQLNKDGKEIEMLLEAALSIMLTCPGSSAGIGTTSTETAVVTNSDGDRVNVSGSTGGSVSVNGTVDVRIIDGVAEVLVPAVFTGGTGGAKWRKVKDLTITDSEITGKISLGLLSSSNFRIDRRSGVFMSNGGFRGQCAKIDEAKRAF